MHQVRIAVVAAMMHCPGRLGANPRRAPRSGFFSQVEIKTASRRQLLHARRPGRHITGRWRKKGSSWWTASSRRCIQDHRPPLLYLELPIKYSSTRISWRPHRRERIFAKDGAIIVAQINVKNRSRRGPRMASPAQDTTGAAGRAAVRHLYELFQDQAQGPRRRPQAHRDAHTDGDTYVWFKTAKPAVDRRHLHQWPPIPISISPTRQHQGHESPPRNLSQADQRQNAHRAGPWPARRQGGAGRVPQDADHGAATACEAGQGKARARLTWWRPNRSRISMPNGRPLNSPAPTSCGDSFQEVRLATGLWPSEFENHADGVGAASSVGAHFASRSANGLAAPTSASLLPSLTSFACGRAP